MTQLPTFLKSFFLTRYRRQFSSRQALKVWQDQQVNRLLQQVLPCSPFYQDYFSGQYHEDWRTFPTINKQLMMEHFNDINTANIKKSEAFNLAMEAEKTRNFTPTIGKITVGLSSGTSGNRGLFLVSPQERAAWAGAMLGKVLPGSPLKKQRIALFLRANSKLYMSLKVGPVHFEYFDLMTPLKENIEKLKRVNPTILIAPPSMLKLLADEIEAGRIQLNLKRIFSAAEVLDPLDEDLITKSFGQKIHQIYQCTEGFLGCSCKHGTLHLNEDLVAIQKEPIDASTGKFFPIVTDLWRTTQPIIRYHLNDILTEARTACPCGSPFMAIESIEGRSDDLFYLPPSGGAGPLTAIFPDFIRRAIIMASPEIKEYFVVQHSPSRIVISLRCNEGSKGQAEKLVKKALEQLFKQLNCRYPAIVFNDPTPHILTKKLQRVRRLFDPKKAI